MQRTLADAGAREAEPEDLRDWFFESMARYCQSAAQRAEVAERRFRIGRQVIGLRFAGGLPPATLTRAFAHLAMPLDGPADLTIWLFDGASAPPPPFLLQVYLSALAHNWLEFADARGRLIRFHEPPVMAVYHPGSDVLSLLDTERRVGFYFRRTAQQIPYYEVASPLRTMLHGWFRGQGMQFVHGAAVGTAAGGVLLAGKGGAGKSTSALACLGSGLQYAGDDYCLVSPASEPHVFSLYNTCKLIGDEDLLRFPGVAGRVWNSRREAGDKPTVFLHEHWPGEVSGGFPLRAILLPRVTGQRDTRLRPAPRMEVLTALAPSTMAQLPDSGASDLRFMKELIQGMPAFFLDVGTDMGQIPAAIQALLARMAG
jgi:hypothetical protein